MKILLLSLLRLGDILLHRQVVQNLKRQYPQAEIHVLIYSQFLTVRNLLPEVDHWHGLDRNEIQTILVERRQSPIQAFEKLQTVIDGLNDQKFDLIFNLTHNRFSVRLMDLIQSPDKRGVALNMGKKVADENAWQTYLNENFSERLGSRFHYLEVLQRALGIHVGPVPAAESRRSPLILLQLLTSDTKKNWGLHRFAELKKKLQQEFPEARVLGLCSPQEKDQVASVFAWNEFLTPSLEEAALLLKEASLLVTGDTSIQHLAAQQSCPVVSLFLGSADPVKTAPWQLGAWVIQGPAACAPCHHSQPCHQATHVCANHLKVETVFSLVSGILRGEKTKLFATGAKRTRLQGPAFGFEPENQELAQLIEQQVWWLHLNGSQKLELPEVSQAECQTLSKRHEEFEAGIQSVKSGRLTLAALEKSFPEWADSLIRWKRDPHFVSEVHELCRIRKLILKKINPDMENENVRTERAASQERLAEA
jgi:ADP-heptose:LPS heptosyltransferase